MEMDTWYDLRFQQLFDLTGRVDDLLDEVRDSEGVVAPAPAPRVCELLGLSESVSEYLEEVQSGQ